MVTKTVIYNDFDGNSRTETLNFNLTQTELVELAMELPDGVSDTIGEDPNKVNQEVAARKLLETLGNKGVFDFIKKLLLKSYGVKSSDGRRFEKSEELSKEFSQTLAFDTILMEFMSDDEAAAKFANGVVPSNVATKVNGIGTNPALTAK